MSLSRNRIRSAVKRDLPIEFSQERISAHGGLELLRRYLAAIDFTRELRQAFRDAVPRGDYGAARLVLAIVGLLVIGGRRLTHLAHVSLDPVLLRFCGLARMPSDRTLVRWLKAFTPPALERLADVIRDGVYRSIEREGLSRLTIDLDGTVLRTGAKVDGAVRGFNPHHPKDPSYYPLTADVAQLGQILRVWNRPGNVADSHHADGFLRVILRELRARFGRAMAIELRMDGAFFMPHVFAFLDEAGVDYAVKVPFWRWLGLQPEVAARSRWTRVDASIDGFEMILTILQWERSARVVVYRKRVAHEKTLAELKHHVAFAAIPTNERMANSAWQMLSALTLNLVRSFQIAAGAAPRRRTWKRTFDYVFPSLQTMRFELIHQPARLVRPEGRPALRFAVSETTRRRIEHVERRLQRAA